MAQSREPEQDAWRHEVDGIIQKSEDTALATSRISKICGEFLIIKTWTVLSESLARADSLAG